jgi:cysteinyl-tRNA synthetase
VKILEQKFLKAANDDLNMPKGLAILWETIRHDKIPSSQKRKLILKFDEVLGLGLKNAKQPLIPQSIMKLIKRREQLRRQKNWQEADAIRKNLEKKGWLVKDTNMGPEILKIKEHKRL